MAITSTGYDGSVNETQWAKLVPWVGASNYGVSGVGDWKVTAHPTMDRGVNVAVGSGWGHGVLDTSDATVSLQGATVSSGSRWDMVVARRNWSGTGGTTSFVLIQGTASQALPARNHTPGTLDDQPIALVQFTAGQTAPTGIVDLRCWGANGGVFAKDALALGYLDPVGGVVQIGTAMWARRLGSNDVAEWAQIDMPPSTMYEPTSPSGFDCSGNIAVEPVAGGRKRVTVDVWFKRTSSSSYNVTGSWQTIGTILPAAVRGYSGNLKYLPIVLTGGTNNTHATLYVDTQAGTVGVRSFNGSFSWTQSALCTINFVYYI